jgi:O-acetylserine/cysteine efflux transporter
VRTRDPGRLRLLAIGALLLANVIGGASYPAQKLALAGLPPATVTFLRGVVAFVPLLVLARVRGLSLGGWTRPEIGRAALVGTLALALPLWLGIVGVERSSSANASILILLEPLTIVLLAAVLLGERPGRAKLVGIGIGFAGAVVIVLEDASLSELFGSERAVGNALLALHGVLWGCHTPLAKPLSEKHDPLALTLLATGFSLPLLALFAAFEHGRWQAGPALASALAWTVVLGLVASLLAVLLWLWALRHIPASSVAGFIFLQPLTGVLIGLAFLDERLSAPATAGCVLISVGVAVDALLTARRRA